MQMQKYMYVNIRMQHNLLILSNSSAAAVMQLRQTIRLANARKRDLKTMMLNLNAGADGPTRI